MRNRCGLHFLKNVSLHRIYFLLYLQPFFVRSGYIHLSSANRLPVEMGSRGRNWVASAFTYSNAAWSVAYNFDFRASGVNPSGGPNNRYFGFPVRCLVY